MESCVKTSIDATIKIKQEPRSIHLRFGEIQMEIDGDGDGDGRGHGHGHGDGRE